MARTLNLNFKLPNNTHNFLVTFSFYIVREEKLFNYFLINQFVNSSINKSFQHFISKVSLPLKD